MRFLFLEPFFGGSHRDFAEGLVEHSRHDIDLLTLPARFWKWRMRGAALHFINAIDNLDGYDGIISGGLLSLADFTALCGPHRPPVLLYFHENQLTYPLAPGERMDLQFGFTDITSALCADRILFNSRFHMDRFFDALPVFISRMPEFKPYWAIDTIGKKADVLYPGCQFNDAPADPLPLTDGAPIIVWNHRWQFDKNPEAFFAALEAIDRSGIDFRLVLLGENCQVKPKAFITARSRFESQIRQYGYVKSKAEYIAWLQKGLVAVSTANQENFGISMVEAMRYGCLPLMPRRLAYPEILPTEFHAAFLYRSQEELVEKLADLLLHPDRHVIHRPVLADMMARHAWPAVIERYDRELEELVKSRG
ncbi:MAG: glycosyl transferase family 1 [Proteobacteria bacterium]|nr:MAG: glycosyl transferase family 1 [Pseudomonadota bacterium]PIE66810.1 MAG: glycosyl transferase family 1 [Deltaproteobacteria bacterium]